MMQKGGWELLQMGNNMKMNMIFGKSYWFSLVCDVDQGSRRDEVKDRKSVHKKTFQRENLIKFGDVDQIMGRNEIKK